MDIKPLTITFAIPDHPWVDGADGADVRIAMTVGSHKAEGEGKLLRVMSETASGEGEVHVQLEKQRGLIRQDLRVGADVASARILRANENISNRGFCLFGAGFIVSEEQAATLGLGQVPGIEQVIRPYRNGRDLTATLRGVRVIDLFGLSAEQARQRYPAVYQHVLERVKPERDVNKRESRRRNWWIFGEPNPKLREQLQNLPRYIVTVETAKHRVFQFLDAEIAPDNKLVAIALDDAAALGILSSSVHIAWALAAGGNLGVGNDPVYVKSRCFEPFPFPVGWASLPTTPNNTVGKHAHPTQDPPSSPCETIRQLAEQLDAHRKQQQALHPGLTLTGIYNVLEKLRSGEPLTAKERTVHEQGVVSVLRQLHDELDAAVLAAYGWSDLLPLLRIAHGNDTPESPSRMDAKRAFDEAVLERLVALNTQRAFDEAQGQIRWLRPELQNPVGWASLPTTTENPAVGKHAHPTQDGGQASHERATRTWPKDPVEQVQALLAVLGESHTPQTCEQITHHFKGRGTWRKQLPNLLAMLTALGHITEENGHYRT